MSKSTWINAFVNYLTFDTINEAMDGEDLRCIIPFSFSTQIKDESDRQGRFIKKKIIQN
jgi:hypothetical protein